MLILPFCLLHFVTAVYKVKGNCIFSSCESFSADWAGSEFNTFRET